jgi:NAD(P)-dependent dehydrogenase (short-subunit alcohol dehydrogenase family)
VSSPRSARSSTIRRYDGQVAVVTGATSGIGRRIALDLAGRGAAVIGMARRKEVLDEVVRMLCAASPDSTTVPCDVGDADAYRAALSAIEADRGRIDILINCAGLSEPASAFDESLDGYRRIMDVNYFGPAAGTLAVVPGMVARRSGIVVNVSSDSVRARVAGIPAYAASKGALSAFTESIAHEVGERGVHVHVLYPGWVPTPMGLAGVEQGMKPPPKATRRTEEQVARLVLDRMGGPSIEINAAPVAVLSTVARAFFPKYYRRMLAAQGIPDARPT